MKRLLHNSRITSALIGITAMPALLLAAGARAELLDDFSDGNDDGWFRFTIPSDLPGASWDADTFVYRLSVVEGEGDTPAGSIVGSNLELTSDPYYWTGYWSATVVRETENSTTHLFMRGIYALGNGYTFGWNPDDGLVIQLGAGGVPAPLANDPTFVQEVGTEYILEAGAIGDELELRMWPRNGARPAFPQVACTDSTYTFGGNGIIARAFDQGSLSATFDDVCFAPPCPADVNWDGAVDVLDLLAVLSAWGIPPSPCPEDINGDGVVDILDVLELLSAWGPC
jgi:hypothetical protein